MMAKIGIKDVRRQVVVRAPTVSHDDFCGDKGVEHAAVAIVVHVQQPWPSPTPRGSRLVRIDGLNGRATRFRSVHLTRETKRELE